VVLAVTLIVLVTRQARSRWPGLHLVLRSADLWFWSVLVVAFLVPGAYMEFPGDPWEHVRRLNLARVEEGLRVGESFSLKLAYFWSWSFTSLVPPDQERAVLSALSTFWQILLTIQFYRFARRLGFSPSWSRLQVLGVVAFFGTDVFSFLRYYALAPTILAYAAYLGAASAVLDLAERRGSAVRGVAALVACLGLIAINHLQEFLFTAIFVAAVFAWRAGVWLGDTPRFRPYSRLAWLILPAGLVLGRLATAHAAGLGLDRINVVALWPWLSRFGILRIWDGQLNFWPTIGIVGVVAVVLAILRPRAHRLLAALTLAAPLLLLFPPFCLAFLEYSHPGNAYRVLYAVPPTFMVIAVLRDLAERRPEGRGAKGPLAIGCAIVTLGALHFAPLWGKLPFQLYSVTAEQSLSAVDATARWLADADFQRDGCLVKSDANSEFAIASLLGTRVTVARATGQHWVFDHWGPLALANPEQVETYVRIYQVCGFLARTANDSALPPCRPSWVGRASAHWQADAGCLSRRRALELPVDALLARGWTSRIAPPFYVYYEPPR
jgi:hypothetical protein